LINKKAEGGFKAVIQGPTYKKTLQTHLERIKDLTRTIDQEAIVRYQHRLKDNERHLIHISKCIEELKASQDSISEALRQEVIAQAGDYFVDRVVNSILSH